MHPQNSLLADRKGLSLFFQLIRWPNIIFIVLTQAAFQFCILQPAFKGDQAQFSSGIFWLVTLSYGLIAAAGYIINDYFDLEIDLLNKPHKVFIGGEISRRQAFIAYILLNVAAIAATVYADLLSGTLTGTLSLLCCIGLLYWYSAALKKSFLVGNIIVAGVTSWSIPVLTYLQLGDGIGNSQLLWMTIIYAGFAFIISLVRELVKDMEDVYGDEALGCRTMPIVWGTQKTKIFALSWLGALGAMVFAAACYLAAHFMWLAAGYTILCIGIPLIGIFRDLIKAEQSAEFHKLSTRIKIVMATGIVSMIFFLLPSGSIS